MSTTIMAQSRNVQGRIVDAKSNEPLIGVTVKEAGTSHGVVTDLDGSFTISVSPDANLLVSYVGYKNLQVPVKGKNKLMVLLEENSEILMMLWLLDMECKESYPFWSCDQCER